MHTKKDKNDPPAPEARRRRLDDTILDDDSSDSDIDVESVLEAGLGLSAGATLLARGPLGQRGSIGNWSADSQDFRVGSQDSLPDLEEPSIAEPLQGSGNTTQGTPR
ncbi:uncharacterized protein [Penaeus vannamei]|uniref:uncharacterized protein n=1 Tax=Penaeus vannamei TaxID=6689 RepID=UPI00387FAB52